MSMLVFFGEFAVAATSAVAFAAVASAAASALGSGADVDAGDFEAA